MLSRLRREVSWWKWTIETLMPFLLGMASVGFVPSFTEICIPLPWLSSFQGQLSKVLGPGDSSFNHQRKGRNLEVQVRVPWIHDEKHSGQGTLNEALPTVVSSSQSMKKELFTRRWSPKGSFLLASLVLCGFHLINLSAQTMQSFIFFLRHTSDASLDVVNQRRNLDLEPSNLTIDRVTFYSDTMASHNSSTNKGDDVSFSNMSKHQNRLQFQGDKLQKQQQQEFRYTPAQQCRLELERWLNPQIDEFLSMGREMPPWLIGSGIWATTLWSTWDSIHSSSGTIMLL